MNVPLPSYRYAIDADDRISAVDAQWLAFARDNDAAKLTEEFVLGRPLWDFVEGAPTRRLYEAVFHTVRQDKATAVVPFRCDSPTLQREMRLQIASSDGRTIHLEGVLCHTQSTPYLPLLDREVHRSTHRLTLCSLCKRALVEPLGWIALDRAVVCLRLSDVRLPPQMVQSVCPACLLYARPSLN